MKKATLIFLLIAPLLSSCAPSRVPAPVFAIEEEKPPPVIIVEKPELKVVIPDEHLIQEGETLVQIALDYGLDYKELALWNGISNPNEIYAGTALNLSSPANAPKTAVVKPATTSAVAPALEPTLSPAAPPASSSTPPPTSSRTVSSAASSTPSPTPSRAASSASSSTAPSTSPSATPSTPPTQSVVVGGAATPAGTAADAPVKKPLAGKYAYNARDLQKLRAEWEAASQQQQAVAPASPSTSAGSSTTKPAASVATAAAASVAPTNVRRRFNVDWSWPVAGKVINAFSESSKGVNIAGQKGDDVFASADGQVVYVGTGVKSYGRLVILKHNNDYLSAYAHNDKILVKEGQRVSRAEKISTMGDSGASQVMLHLEVRKAGKPFDPMQVLPLKP